jgi:hypothetical protein
MIVALTEILSEGHCIITLNALTLSALDTDTDRLMLINSLVSQRHSKLPITAIAYIAVGLLVLGPFDF